jgi:hypothetical protein
MLYDLLIDAKSAGTKEVEYTVTATRTNTDVPQKPSIYVVLIPQNRIFF